MMSRAQKFSNVVKKFPLLQEVDELQIWTWTSFEMTIQLLTTPLLRRFKKWCKNDLDYLLTDEYVMKNHARMLRNE
jgi:hypothetical protein